MNPYGLSDEGLEFIESAGAAIEAEAQNFNNMNTLNLMGSPTEDMSATSILSLFETTKEQRQSFVNQVIESVTGGFKNPLDIQVQIKCLEDILKGVTDNRFYKDALVTEAQKYGKTFEFHNSTIQVKEAGTKYDFTKTDDAEWARLDAEMFELKAKLKKREDFLKMLPTEGLDILDGSTGETYKIYPPAKSSTTTISVSLK